MSKLRWPKVTKVAGGEITFWVKLACGICNTRASEGGLICADIGCEECIFNDDFVENEQVDQEEVISWVVDMIKLNSEKDNG